MELTNRLNIDLVYRLFINYDYSILDYLILDVSIYEKKN